MLENPSKSSITLMAPKSEPTFLGFCFATWSSLSRGEDPVQGHCGTVGKITTNVHNWSTCFLALTVCGQISMTIKKIKKIKKDAQT